MGLRHVVVLSPHFDDVPLSLGQSLTDGLLADQRVTVAVVFSRSNWTQWFHPTRRRAPLVSALRRMEEGVAGRRFGYRVVTLGVEEWPLRTGRTDVEGLLDPRADVTSDPVVHEAMVQLRPHLDEADAVWACAAVGHHVDHQVVREVGARLVDGGRGDVAFYLDRPYTALVGGHEVDRARERLASRLGLGLAEVDVSPPIGPDLARRLRRTYPSQIDELFRGAMDADVATRARERVWVPERDLAEAVTLFGSPRGPTDPG